MTALHWLSNRIMYLGILGHHIVPVPLSRVVGAAVLVGLSPQPHNKWLLMARWSAHIQLGFDGKMRF